METIIFGEVNATGRAAVVEWLGTVLKNDENVEAWADELIGSIDGSYAEDLGLNVEVGAMYTKSHHTETYRFGDGEYDLVTCDDMGREIFRETVR